MKEELEQKLIDDFGFMLVGCECSDGWFDLIHQLCKEIQEYYISKHEDIYTLRILQIKEKYGRLCFYVGNYIDGVDEIINKYEKLSLKTCEVCGGTGELMINGSWLRTLCNKHGEEYNYKKLNRSNDYV